MEFFKRPWVQEVLGVIVIGLVVAVMSHDVRATVGASIAAAIGSVIFYNLRQRKARRLAAEERQ